MVGSKLSASNEEAGRVRRAHNQLEKEKASVEHQLRSALQKRDSLESSLEKMREERKLSSTIKDSEEYAGQLRVM